MYYTWHARGMMTKQRWHRRQASTRSTKVPQYGGQYLAPKVPATEALLPGGGSRARRARSSLCYVHGRRMRAAEGFWGMRPFFDAAADRAEQEQERICAAPGLNPPCDPAASSSDRVPSMAVKLCLYCRDVSRSFASQGPTLAQGRQVLVLVQTAAAASMYHC